MGVTVKMEQAASVVPVITDVVSTPKPRTLCIWTKDKSTDVYAVLSPIIQAQRARFDAIKCTVSNDLEKFPTADVVFAMGTAPLKQVQDAGVGLAKNRTISSTRSLPHRVGNTDVFFSYSAGIRDVDYGWFVELLCDFSNAIVFAATGQVKPPMGTYEWVDDFTKLVALVEAQFAATGKPVDLTFDTETEGNDYISSDGRFVMLQFSWAVNTGCAIYVESHEHAADLQKPGGVVYEQLKWLFTTDKVRIKAANGKYDFIWVRQKFGIKCTNFKFDTTLVGSMLDENRSNSLDVHAKLHSNIGGYSDLFDSKVDKSHMALLPKNKDLLDYGCGDTDATFQTAAYMKTELLKDAAATKFYVNCLHPGARAFEVIERGGIFVDMPAYAALEAELNAELARLVKDVIGVVGGRIYAKHLDETKTGGLNITKPSLIKDFMFSPMGLNLKPKMRTEKTSEPVTSDEHLQMFKDVPEAKAFIGLREAYSSANKVLGYCTGFREDLRQDGRFHPWYFLFKGKFDNFDNDLSGGTTTGRLSAKGPPVQVIPKHSDWGKKMRRIFSAPPGFVVCERDYNQGELRVVACIANVQKMIEAYKAGRDLHALTGAFIKGMTYEAVMALKKTAKDLFQLIRQPAKPCIAEGQLVLTAHGEVPIETITSLTLLWDGVEYVRHDGLVHKGEQHVFRFDGLEATGGHVCFTDGGELPLLEAAYGNHRLVVTGRDGVPVRYADGGRATNRREAQESSGDLLSVQGDVPCLPAEPEAQIDEVMCVPAEQEVPSGASEGTRGEVRRDLPAVYEPECTVLGELRWSRGQVAVSESGGVYLVVPVEPPAPDVQGSADRQEGQRRGLRTGEPSLGYAAAEFDEQADVCTRGVPRPAGERLAFVAPAEDGSPNAVYRTLAGREVSLTRLTGVEYLGRKRTFDIADAGPRNRFTVSGKLVHNCNFGLLYGQGEEGLQRYAELNYNVVMSLEEAGRLRTLFFKLYSELLEYHAECKRVGHKYGYVRSPLGRVRHLPLINSRDRRTSSSWERKAINSPVQSTLSDMLVWSLGIENEMGGLDEAPCFATIHDACYDYLPEGRAEEIAEKKRAIMENLPFEKVGWSPQLKFLADVKLGPNMGDLTELERKKAA